MATYTSAMRTTAGAGPILDGHGTDAAFVLNVSSEYRVAPWHTAFFVGVRNLLDRAYVVARRPAGVRPGLPRTLMGGARVRL